MSPLWCRPREARRTSRPTARTTRSTLYRSAFWTRSSGRAGSRASTLQMYVFFHHRILSASGSWFWSMGSSPPGGRIATLRSGPRIYSPRLNAPLTTTADLQPHHLPDDQRRLAPPQLHTHGGGHTGVLGEGEACHAEYVANPLPRLTTSHIS